MTDSVYERTRSVYNPVKSVYADPKLRALQKVVDDVKRTHGKAGLALLKKLIDAHD